MVDPVRTRPRDRRASILAAARRRFHQSGYAGTSLEDIAGDLGITAPALYRHFRGKDALYTAALESTLGHLERCVEEASSADEVVRGLALVAVEHPTLGLLWNPDRRRRLTDPEGAIQTRLRRRPTTSASCSRARIRPPSVSSGPEPWGFLLSHWSSNRRRRRLR